MTVVAQRQQSHAPLIFVAAGVAILWSSALERAKAEDGDPTTIARGLAAAWNENRASFSRFSCRYRLTKGTAASRDDAFAGNLTNVVFADGLWAVNGDFERCSLVTDDESIPRTAIESRDGVVYETAPIATSHLFRNASLSLRYSGVMRGATLWSAEWGQVNDLVTPFGMEMMGPGEQSSPANTIEQHLKKGGVIDISDGTGIGDGDGMTIRWEIGRGRYRSYTFDPARGFLTSSIVVQFSPLETVEAHITAAQQSPDGFWFPMESVRLSILAREGARLAVQRIEVTELSFSSEPEDFTFTMPAGARLNARSIQGSQHRLEHPLEVSPEVLPDLETRCRQVAQNRGGGLPTTHGLPEPRRTNWWLVIGISAVVAAGTWGLLRVFRSR